MLHLASASPAMVKINLPCSYQPGRQITFTYDSQSRISGITDPLGHSVSYAYDSNGNLISVTDQLGKTTTYEYNNLTHQHQLLTVTDPKGNKLSG